MGLYKLGPHEKNQVISYSSTESSCIAEDQDLKITKLRGRSIIERAERDNNPSQEDSKGWTWAVQETVEQWEASAVQYSV